EPFLDYVIKNTSGAPGRPIFRDWYKAMRWDLKRVCEKLKIEGVSSNDLRRSYAEWPNQRDVSAKLTGASPGHAPGSKVTEQTYIRERAQEVRRLIDNQLRLSDVLVQASSPVAVQSDEGGQNDRQK